MIPPEEYKDQLHRAKEIIRTSKNPSTSYLQRKMLIGYGSADKLLIEISSLDEFKFVKSYRDNLYARHGYMYVVLSFIRQYAIKIKSLIYR